MTDTLTNLVSMTTTELTPTDQIIARSGRCWLPCSPGVKAIGGCTCENIHQERINDPAGSLITRPAIKKKPTKLPMALKDMKYFEKLKKP